MTDQPKPAFVFQIQYESTPPDLKVADVVALVRSYSYYDEACKSLAAKTAKEELAQASDNGPFGQLIAPNLVTMPALLWSPLVVTTNPVSFSTTS